jgi:lactoylglutathione lyase
MKIKYLHTMVRVKNIERSLSVYKDLLGLEETRRIDNEAGKFTLIFLAPPGQEDCPVELTYNWDTTEDYDEGRNFGHLAYEVEDIYETCKKLQGNGIKINRPPRDGRMAFVRSPDNISIELLQAGEAKELSEPWLSMKNDGHW